MTAEQTAKLYSRDLCFERFKYNRDKNKDQLSKEAEEQMKKNYKLDDEQFGQQLWGIGYISSDWEPEEDDQDDE